MAATRLGDVYRVVLCALGRVEPLILEVWLGSGCGSIRCLLPVSVSTQAHGGKRSYPLRSYLPRLGTGLNVVSVAHHTRVQTSALTGCRYARDATAYAMLRAAGSNGATNARATSRLAAASSRKGLEIGAASTAFCTAVQKASAAVAAASHTCG
jgi:hypothetical protein